MKAAVPAYSAATLVALSRIRENKHWVSDVVAGAFIGTYWARVGHGIQDQNYTLTPVPFDGGFMLVFNKPY